MPEHAPFPIQPELTAIALAHRNRELIADQVLPRVGVGAKTFKWLEYNTEERFTIPDTKVGRKGEPNEVEFSATEKESSVVDHGLDDVVPNEDLEQNAPNYDPIGEAVSGITDLIMLAREKRVADMVFNTNTYGANNKTALSGGSQWSDYANSDPINAILTARDGMMSDANALVIGQDVFTKLRQHPKIAKATHGNSGDVSVVARQAIAELLELDEIIVGTARVNTANKGQTATYARLWGNYAALIYKNPQARPNKGITFGLTAEWGGRIAGQMNEQKTGLRGSQRVRVGESVRELIMAADAGYLFSNVV